MAIRYNICGPNPDFQKLSIDERLAYVKKKCDELSKNLNLTIT